MKSKVATRGSYRLALPAACLVALAAFSTGAGAQILIPEAVSTCGSTTPGLNGGDPPICTVAGGARVATGQSCGFERGGTNCTANDFIANASVTTNTLPACTLGQSVPGQSLIFQIASANTDRQAPGLFIAEQGQDLSIANPGKTCTVATFPTANTFNGLPGSGDEPRVPFPWFAQTAGDVCGSYLKQFTSVEEVDGITIVCQPGPDGIHPAINFMIAYANNAAGATACSGPSNVKPGTAAKCGVSQAPITNIVIQYQANPTCSFGQDGFTRDNVAHTFTKKFTITNNGPDDAGLANAGNVSFTDTVPAPFTVTGVSCGNPQVGAACGAAGNFTFSGNDVSGTIATLPNGGSVDITITGTFPAGDQSGFDNIVTLAVNTDNIITPAEWANTCNVTGTLPVKLQKFDVQ